MAYLVDQMSDAYLREIADYFAALDLPYPPPQTTGAPAATLSRAARQLVRQGDAARGIPACSSCHGAAMTGVAPAMPGLLGCRATTSFRSSVPGATAARRAAAPDCMGEIARRLGAGRRHRHGRLAVLAAGAAWAGRRGQPARPAADGMRERPAMSAARSRWIKALALLVVLGAAAAALVGWLNVRGEAAVDASVPSGAAPAELVAARRLPRARRQLRGLPHRARRRRRSPAARASTPRSAPCSPATSRPMPETGIGSWSDRRTSGAPCTTAARATAACCIRHSRTPNYTQITREDSDALYAFLRSQPPVQQPNRPHALRFPVQLAGLAGGLARAVLLARRLRARSRTGRPSGTGAPTWCAGLGHCQACHAPRNAFGATATSWS